MVSNAFGIVGYSQLQSLDIPNLKYVGADLVFQFNHVLEEIILPSLQIIGGEFMVFHNSNLKKLSAPNLTEIGKWIEIIVNRQLRQVEFFNLVNIHKNRREEGMNHKIGIDLIDLMDVVALPRLPQDTLEQTRNFNGATKKINHFLNTYQQVPFSNINQHANYILTNQHITFLSFLLLIIM